VDSGSPEMYTGAAVAYQRASNWS